MLRHSSASLVTIEWIRGELAVSNDGVAGVGAEGGTGLAGVRERLAPLGASLRASRRDSTFTVVATLPGDGPAEETR